MEHPREEFPSAPVVRMVGAAGSELQDRFLGSKGVFPRILAPLQAVGMIMGFVGAFPLLLLECSVQEQDSGLGYHREFLPFCCS